jgi:protocatechuate 3,4-dioxygenase beta subunit
MAPVPGGKPQGGAARLGRNRLLLAALPAAVLGGLLLTAGSVVTAAAGASASGCTGTLGGLLLSGGSGQAARTGTGYADPLAAEVVDTGGCPLSDVDVEFVAPTSGAGATFPGAATTATVTTGSDGIATAPALTANQVSGSFTVVAEVASTSYQVSFDLDNTTAGVASSVGASSGDGQSARVGEQFALPLAVNVSDSYGAPVPDASVNFTVVPTNGAQASFVGGGSTASVQTNGSGTATSPLLVAGSSTGTFTVQASVSGVSKLVTFTLTDRAAAAYAITAGAGTSQEAQVGADFAVPLAVTVTDANGNPVAGAQVTFSAPNSGPSGVFAGHGATAIVTTTSKGVAVGPSFSANQVEGGYIVTARVGGLASVATFALVNTARTGAATGSPAGSYWLATQNGHVYSSGSAARYSALAGGAQPSHVAGMAATPDGRGYWLVTTNGKVYGYGEARSYGSASHPAAPVAGIASTADGRGYWLAASNGAVYAFGDAHNYGSEAASKLPSPIVGIAGSASGKGYWLAAKNGGVFAFGQASPHGSPKSLHLSAPVVGITAVPGGKGYWLVGRDGGVFSFGSATFFGSANGVSAGPAVALMATPDGGGYWVVSAKGAVTGFGDAGSQGPPAATGEVVAGAAFG